MGELMEGTGTDPLNDLLELFSAAKIYTSVIPTPQGAIGLLTVRTTSATVTITAAKADAVKWAEHITRWAASIPGAGLIAPPSAAGAIIVPKSEQNGGKHA